MFRTKETKKNREEKKPKRKRYDNYAPLNYPLSRIFREKASSDLRDRPPPMLTKGDKLDSKRFCDFHNSHGHNTDECLNLKDKVEELVRAGRLAKYVALSSGDLPRPRSPTQRRSVSPTKYRARSPVRHNYHDNRQRAPPRRDDRRRSPERRIRPDRRRSPKHHGQNEVRRHHGMNLLEIGSIAGGFAAGGPTSNSRKRSTRMILHSEGRPRPKPQETPKKKLFVGFSEDDYGLDTGEEDDPIVIEALIGNGKIKRVLVDTCSSTDIMFYEAYKGLHLSVKDLVPYDHDLVGFTGDRVLPLGYFDTCLSLGDPNYCWTIRARFLVVECPMTYNAILGIPSLNIYRSIISTHHLMLKYPWAGRVISVRGDLAMARGCYNSSCRLAKEERKRKKACPTRESESRRYHHDNFMTDLDPRVDQSREDRRL